MYVVIVIRRARRQTDYQPVLEDWLFHTIFPLVSYTALVVAALLLPGHPAPALFVIAAAGASGQPGNLSTPDTIFYNGKIVTVDAGSTPPAGGGIEVRYSDAGWGVDNNRNLVGRFTTSSFTLTRYARAQNYFLRSYDGSVPPKYSRYSTALHVDYPF